MCKLHARFVIIVFSIIMLTELSACSVSNIGIGEEGRLYIDGSSPIGVSVDKESLNELISSIIIHDSSGIQNLILKGKVFIVEEDTRILVIDRGFTSTKVRILEGGNTGMAGWVPSEWVK